MNFWTERDAVIDDDPGVVVAERRTRLGKAVCEQSRGGSAVLSMAFLTNGNVRPSCTKGTQEVLRRC